MPNELKAVGSSEVYRKKNDLKRSYNLRTVIGEFLKNLRKID